MVIHYELLKLGEFTANVCFQQLERLKGKLKEKRPALVNRKQIIFHRDNGKLHTASITREKIRELNGKFLVVPFILLT